MSDFVPGFAVRQHIGDALIERALADAAGFAPTPSYLPEPSEREPFAGPRHFSPADRARPADEAPAAQDAPRETTPDGGFVDPIAAARTTGYAEGLVAGKAEAEAERTREVALVDQVSSALISGAHVDRERMAELLRQTVLLLVTRLVGEIGVSPELLEFRIAAAADLLADSAESALLRLNPQDLPLIEGKLPDRVFAAGDPHVARGAFVLESASTLVEDGPAMWLEQLASAIDRVPLPGGA